MAMMMEEEGKLGQGQEGDTGEVLSSQRWMERLKERNPERKYDDDPEEFYRELDAYDGEMSERIGRYEDSSNRMKELMLNNPELAGIFNDVASGKHPAVAFVEYFGEGVMNLKNDPELAEEMVGAQNAYLDRVANSKKIEDEQNANMEASRAVFEDFVKEKGMSEDDGTAFFDRIIQTIDDVFMCRYSPELLEVFFKGMNYDMDVASAAEMGEVNGKNQKIRAGVKASLGDGLPKIQGAGIAASGGEKKGVPVRRNGFFENVGRKR